MRASLLIGAICLFTSIIVAVFAKQMVDYPISTHLNYFATRSAFFDYLVELFVNVHLLKGVLLLAGVWLVWFAVPQMDMRARIVSGLIAVNLASLLSRAVQVFAPVRQRPLSDLDLSIVSPLGIDPLMLTGSGSLPSDHAVLLFGVATVLTIIRPTVGAVGILIALLVCVCRIYSGLHYMSDILAGAGLGMLAAGASQLAPFPSACQVFPRWANNRAGVFYAAAFVVTYLMATLFEDVRHIARGLAKLLLLY
jgi:membrane-associated phospholipid phosphatase